MSIIEMFYKHITDKELSDIQSKKIKKYFRKRIEKGGLMNETITFKVE